MKKIFKIAFILVSVIAQNAVAAVYEAPPSSSVKGHVPYISDAAMKECVVLYNKAKWLMTEIDGTRVDHYSENSVNNYNKKINRHSSMIDAFNRDCAGKQSYSAYKAAQALNNR